ncbi:MAG: hypothetical protein K2K63_11605 [Acetatifactor sp.]|nr:hypothetical protein [Acetatifactor sp.]
MNDIYVFGKGNYWKYKSDLVKKTYRVVGYIDNNKGEISEADGVPVYFPHEAVSNKAIRIAVMVSSKFSIELVKQLLELGVEEQRIILGGNIEPFFDAGERLLHQMGGGFTLHDGKMFVSSGQEEYAINSEEEYSYCIRRLAGTTPFYAAVKNMPLVPISRNYGTEFGKPIDRYYIEKFLENNREYIQGDVIEIEDTTYTKKYGHSLKSCFALHVEEMEDCIKGNLETGEGIDDGMADCLICTQTLQYIYHPENAAKNMWKMLKEGGTALITMPFLCQYFEGAHSWNDYWRATPQCLKKVLAETFGEDNVEAGSLGNIKTAIGFLYGLCCDDIDEGDFDYNDKEYPVTVWAICHRR